MRWDTYTLRAAFGEKVNCIRRKRQSERTVEKELEAQRLLGPWLYRSVATIQRAEAQGRHAAITVSSGPYAANRALREFRSLYNLCLRLFEDMPVRQPWLSIDWNPEQRRRDTVPWAALPGWFAQVDTLAPCRRALQLTYLFTGVRRLEAATLRWADVDLHNGTAHIRSPKGGAGRAYVSVSMEHLRGCVEKVAVFLLARFSERNGGQLPNRLSVS